jgi:ribosomal protein S20
VRKYRDALTAGNVDEARSLLAPTLSLIDRTAKSNAIRANTASRAKARLTRALNRLSTSGS